MLTTHHFTASQIKSLEADPYFSPLVPLFRKFGTCYDDGSIKVNLRKPVMPDPAKTKWNLLLFNENDCLVDLIWDLFLKHGESYQSGIEVFDLLRAHIPCLVLTGAEKSYILRCLSAYRSDYEGTSEYGQPELDLYHSIQAKLGNL